MSEKIEVRLASKHIEADDIASYRFVALDGATLPAFTLGSHVDVFLPNGLIRSYSLVNMPGSDFYQITVLRNAAGRGGSMAVHDLLSVGDKLFISQPRNNFNLVEDGSKAIFVAGGIGITPLYGMAKQLHAAGTEFAFHYSARSRSKMAFLDALQASDFAQLHLYFDDEAAMQIDAVLGQSDRQAHVYVCGPRGLIDAVLDKGRALGWSNEHLHFELFGNEISNDNAHEFDIKIQSSGQIIRVPENCSVIQALAAQGIQISTSCEQGVCGTCLTHVIDGEPDHRDMYLSDDEKNCNQVFLPCCSRSKSKMLVIDL